MSKIPKNIFQTFEHTDFNPHFQKLIDDWKIENPDYNYLIYDKNQREEFIKDNFPSEVWEAYTRIKPGAFKSDLWRYCILHKYGGFYMDIDTVCLGQLDMFIRDDIDFVAAIDLNLGDLEFHNVANAFIGCTPEHPVIAQCIQNVITIVDAEALPYNIMNFCGPGCLGMIINKYLGRREKESMVDFQGNHNKIQLIHFERYTEYIRNLNGKKILQNKNSHQQIKELYDLECGKVENYFDWGKFGFKNVRFEDIVVPNPFTIDKNITLLSNYHNNNPAAFHLFTHCGVSDCIRRGWRWEEHQHQIINKYLNKDSIAVEVGAHIGTITVKLSKTTKQVYAFEPIRQTYNLLKRNLLLNVCQNVKTYECALGNKISNEKVKWISENNVGGTGLEDGYVTKDSNLSTDIIVDVKTLDSMGFDHIDYIKIDAEGYEEWVVEGGIETITRDLPLIVLECFDEKLFNSHTIDAPKATNEEIERRFGLLIDLGYIYEHVYFEDFIFIPPKLQ